MRTPKTVVVAIVALILGVTVATGITAAVTAGASGTSTYYACLKAGKLTKVGVSAPTCKAPAVQISWDSVGPAGATGAQGPAGPQGPPGATLNTCATPPGPGLNFNGCILPTDGQTGQWSSVDLTGASLVGTYFNGMSLVDTNFTDVNLSYATFYVGNLTGAIGLASDNLTGVTWDGVLCPDGTSSSQNGDSCVGHLTPA